MKNKYLYITGILLLGLNLPAQAQTESDQAAFDDFQSSLNQFAESAAETYEYLKQQYNEYVRVAALLSSDIRMMMKADSKGTNLGNVEYKEEGDVQITSSLFYYITPDTKNSLYAEFDWQNMAEKMHLKSSGGMSYFGIGGLYHDMKYVEEQDFNMYIDPLGYWYVPSGNLKGWGSDADYLRVNPMGGMSNMAKMLEVGIQAAIDAKVSESLDQIGLLIALQINATKIDMSVPEPVQKFLSEYGEMESFDEEKNPTEDKLKSIIKDLVKLQFEQITGFPAFIHFAFIISPTLVRNSFGVQESTVTWGGQDSCTKMTVLSGSDAGYQIVFDRYGRLIHLRDTDGSTADYWYDKDVTVNIPPAAVINMDVLMQLSQPSMSDK